jgi:hypothetical protein
MTPNIASNEVVSPRYVLEFTLPGLPRTANGSHGNWRAKHAQVRAWKQATFAHAWPKRPPEPLTRAVISFKRHSSTEPDFDNLAISFKPILDGLRQAGVIVDDKRANVGRPNYDWEYAPRNKGFISVRVESAP